MSSDVFVSITTAYCSMTQEQSVSLNSNDNDTYNSQNGTFTYSSLGFSPSHTKHLPPPPMSYLFTNRALTFDTSRDFLIALVVR
jgi:hypothetical protein